MATITLPAVFASAAKQNDGTTVVPFVNPLDPSAPRYAAPKGHSGVNPAGGWGGVIPEAVPTAAPDRSVTGAATTPTNARRAPSYDLTNAGYVKPTTATAGAPATVAPVGSYVGDAASLATVTASPATAWTGTQYLQTAIGGAPGGSGGTNYTWNGTSWATTGIGTLPSAAEPEESAEPAANGTATGATAGTPGEWTPEGAAAPQTMATAPALEGQEAWAPGEYVYLRNGSTHLHWTGDAWASGDAA